MAMIRQPENFPATVKEVRRQLALSQEELAHALGVSFATVNRWENGKTIPSKLAQRQFEQFCKDNVKKGNLVLNEVNKCPVVLGEDAPGANDDAR
jgi:transcriptional regulator with XRE-family HTH domain